MFTIYTNSDGIKYTYQVHAGEDSPEMDLIDTEETSEGNGTTIRINIKSGDYDKFTSAVKSQLKYFDNIEYEGIDIGDYQLIRGTNFIVNTSNNIKLDLSVGKVRYPINTDIVDLREVVSTLIQEDYKFELPGYYFHQNTYKFGLRFDIGEIEVVWNREAINYSDKTINTIKSKFKAALIEIYEIFESKKDKVDNLIDFYEYIGAAKDSNDKYIPISDTYNLDVSFIKNEITYKKATKGILNQAIGAVLYCHGQYDGSEIQTGIYYKKKLSKLLSTYKDSIALSENTIRQEKAFTLYNRTNTGYFIIKKQELTPETIDYIKSKDLTVEEFKSLIDYIIAKIPYNLDDIVLSPQEEAKFKEYKAERTKQKYMSKGLFVTRYTKHPYRSKWSMSTFLREVNNKKVLTVYGYKEDEKLISQVAYHVTPFNNNFLFISVAKSNYDIYDTLENAMHINDFIKNKRTVLNRIAQRYRNLLVIDLIQNELSKLDYSYTINYLPIMKSTKTYKVYKTFIEPRDVSRDYPLFKEGEADSELTDLLNSIKAISITYPLYKQLSGLVNRTDAAGEEARAYFDRFIHINPLLLWKRYQKSLSQETTTTSD